jgi:hypothetical protein
MGFLMWDYSVQGPVLAMTFGQIGRKQSKSAGCNHNWRKSAGATQETLRTGGAGELTSEGVRR